MAKKNKTAQYPALKYITTISLADDYKNDYEKIILPFINKITNSPDNFKMSRSEFIKAVLSRYFMTARTPEEDNILSTECKLLYDNTIKNAVDILGCLGYDPKTIIALKNKGTSAISFTSEIRDLYVEYLIINDWIKNKQVLKPDPVFAKHLIKTDKLNFDASNLKLPFNTFYLDLENCNADNYYGDIYGAYIDVRDVYDDTLAITFYVLDRKYRTVSNYITIRKDTIKTIDVNDLRDETSFDTAPAIPDQNKIYFNSRRITVLILQLLCYMQIREPDINISEKTKTYYRKPDVNNIKNKYSEIYEQEIGIRIGKKITQNISAMNAAKETQTAKALAENRKPPIPHFRAAHWSHYWTGKGRTNCELRWIEPIFVCGDYDSSKNSDVIIHKVD